MALFIASKAHLTFYNFIIPTIHNIYDASTVTIARCLAGFITQPKIHLTIRADKAVQWTSSHLLHTRFCKNLVFVFCCVWCRVYCCNEKKKGGGDWQSQYPDPVWNTSSPTVVHLHEAFSLHDCCHSGRRWNGLCTRYVWMSCFSISEEN